LEHDFFFFAGINFSDTTQLIVWWIYDLENRKMWILWKTLESTVIACHYHGPEFCPV